MLLQGSKKPPNQAILGNTLPYFGGQLRQHKLYLFIPYPATYALGVEPSGKRGRSVAAWMIITNSSLPGFDTWF